MPLSLQFAFPLPHGLHARPASLLEAVARRYLAGITLANRRTRTAADVKSVLALIGLDTRHQDACELTVSGPDEREALAALTVFIRDTLPRCDDPLPVGAAAPASRLPAMLAAATLTPFYGTPVVPGIAAGRVLLAGGFHIPPSLPQSGCADPAAEWETLAAALQRVIAYYDQRLALAKNQLIRDLLLAHQAIARDPELSRQLHQAVAQNGRTAAGAIADTTAHFTDLFARSGSALLRERGLDIQDVALNLLRQVYGAAAQTRELKLAAPTILLAESLTPGQFLALDRAFLRGLVLLHAGTTSHTVILARSFGLPTLTGAAVTDAAALAGQEAVLDGFAGALLTRLTDPARRYYAREQLRLIGRQQHLQAIAARAAAAPAVRKIEIAANIANAGETAAAVAAGAEGIGLFRTEMLFLDRAAPPDEAEQFAAYRTVLAAAGDRTVIIRTLDSGGDKPLDYLHLPAEDNPFLGFRAVRIYPRFEELFRTQIRALLRASAHGRLKLLVPMIAMLDEVRWVKRIIAEEQARCLADGLPYATTMEIGAMIEVPAAAFIMDTLCHELDFFSIGTNDLLQYFTAADRANPNVAALYNPLQPAFLRLLKLVVDQAHQHGKWIGLCGEMGGQTRWLPLLAGLGLDEISVPAPAIAQIRAELAGWAPEQCRQLLAAALNCATADEVAALLRQTSARAAVPLFAPELLLTAQTALTREEAVKLATDHLYVLGRTDDSRALELAILDRENNCSTGFGFGFAIPHGQTDALRSDSLVLLKLTTPVPWNALDGQPVGVIFLLCVRAGEPAARHLPVLARLARRVLDPDFRFRVQAENDPSALYALLQESLGKE